MEQQNTNRKINNDNINITTIFKVNITDRIS